MAPELFLKMPYSGEKIDVFASAVVLFVLISGHFPFSMAHKSDSLYTCLAINRPDIFWAKHERGKSPYSKEFKDLFEKMINSNFEDRFSIR